jgi:hypothetical protein
VTRVSDRRLHDRVDIIELMNRYALGVDRRDWALYRSCFEDRFAIVAEGWPDAMDADEWVDIIRQGIHNYAATQHQMSNHTIEVDGDAAHCITYIRAVHHQPKAAGGSQWVLVGYYDLDLTRHDSGWKIARFNLTTWWSEGNLALSEIGPQPPAR